jgi:hypothetical protein
MIYVTGDLHGGDVLKDINKLSADKFPEGRSLTRDDYVIICGDFGFPWLLPKTHRGYKSNMFWLDWLTKLPFTILFVDGNHEYYPLLTELPKVNRFGSRVGQLADNIFHLTRGNIYYIDRVKFLTLGGAASIDKDRRVPGVSWFKEELLSKADEDRTLKNLDDARWRVDYVITHTGPSKVMQRMGLADRDEEDRYYDPVAKFHQHLLDNGLTFKRWYFGHMHSDCISEDKFVATYNVIHKVAT